MTEAESLVSANNPASQPPSTRSMSKRRLLTRQEQTVFECDRIEELAIILSEQVETCRSIDIPLALVLMEITNFDVLDLNEEQDARDLVNKVAHHLLPVLRGQDVIAHYGKRYVALLLCDSDQIIAARVCQRIKEFVHRFAYLNHKLGGPIELAFGVSDDSQSKYFEIESVIFAAARALNLAHQLGDGAIVRESDLDPRRDSTIREHFLPGDRWSSRTR